MGKSKAKKYKSKPTNPTGMPSFKELEEMEEKELEVPIDVDAGTIESIIEKLQSRNVEDRECSAVIIANMAGNKEFIESIIKEKALRVAAPLLLDKNLSVRHAIAGCLRNVAVCGDYLVSEAMVKQDIMTSLVMLLEQYKDPWSPVKTTENTIDSKSAIFLEACNLLWILCENSDTAVSIFNKTNLIEILTPCLNVEIYGLQIPTAVAQCLHTCGENNPDLSEILRQSLVEEQLKALMNLSSTDTDRILLKTLAAGIKLNIFSGKLKNCMSDVTNSIVEVVFATFNESINSYIELLHKQIVSLKAEKSDKYHEEKDLDEKSSAVKKTKNDLINVLSAKQISLEILGNIFDDDSNEDWEDISSSDSSEIMGETMQMEIDGVRVDPYEIGFGISIDLYKTIVSRNVLGKVTEQIVNPSDEAFKSLQGYPKAKDCLKRIDTLRCTALLCLNNVIQKAEIEDLGGPSKLLELWLYLANLLFKETDSKNVEQVEAITRSMSAVARKLAEANYANQFSNMTDSDLELLINICHQSEDSRIKVHIIRILGTIGCLLGSLNSQNSASLIKIIGSVLLDICSKNIDMWVVAEALDVIFDVFAEDPVDSIAREINLVEKLTHMMPIFKAKIKQQRKSFGDHLPVIMTARDNLLRFIKYKNDLNT